jgi:hypothetical protein
VPVDSDASAGAVAESAPEAPVEPTEPPRQS